MKIRKLYLITIILTIIGIIIGFVLQNVAEIQCKPRLEISYERYESCVRSMSEPRGGLEIYGLIMGIFWLFSVAGLISDGLHFIVRKIKNMF